MISKPRILRIRSIIYREWCSRKRTRSHPGVTIERCRWSYKRREAELMSIEVGLKTQRSRGIYKRKKVI